jgi:hypothetical protein
MFIARAEGNSPQIGLGRSFKRGLRSICEKGFNQSWLYLIEEDVRRFPSANGERQINRNADVYLYGRAGGDPITVQAGQGQGMPAG